MKIKQLDDRLDCQIITYMIVSDRFLSQVIRIYSPELMKTPFAAVVANWCISFHEQHSKAPGKHIQDIFYSEQRRGLDEELADSIGTFLSRISDEYENAEKLNIDYLLKRTGELFTARRLQHLSEDVQVHLTNGDVEDALTVLTSFKLPQHSPDLGVNALEDFEALLAAEEERREPLFQLKGTLGQLLNPHLVRGGFVAFLGRAKIGKTWRLMDLAMEAAMSRLNVAVFQMGDLSQNDYLIRQGVYVTKISNDHKYLYNLTIPVLDCQKNQSGTCMKDNKGCPGLGETPHPSLVEEVDHIPCSKCYRQSDFVGSMWWKKIDKIEPLSTRQRALRTLEWKKRKKVRGFKLKSYSNSSANTRDIVTALDLWETNDGFIPDVIIIDYADIMAPEDPKKERRHQENERWQALRKLSQDRNCLVITVSQADAGSYEQESLKLTNFNEDRRKYDHVTAFFALNQTSKEAELGTIRIAPLLVREGACSNQQVVVLQSIATGQPHIASYWWQKKKGER